MTHPDTAPDISYQLHRLDDGFRLLTAPMRDRTSVSLAMMVGVGSRHETRAESGLSHFIEHLCFKGTRLRAGSREIAEAIEGVGGVINAATDKETTVFYVKVPARRLGLAADVLTDLVLGPRFDPADIDKERLVILEEIKMYEDLPQDFVHTLFEELLWPDHALGRDIAGSPETVSAFQRDDLLRYTTQHYRANRILAVAAGAVDHDEVVAELKGRLQARSGAAPGDDRPPGPATSPRLVLRKKRTEQAHICVGGMSCSYLDPRRHAEEVVNTLLGEGMSSRLFLEVRERLGLAYDVHAFMSKHSDTGSFGVYAGVEPRKAQQALEAVLQQMRILADVEVPAAELTKAKEYYKGRLLLGLESTNGLAAWLGGQELLQGEILQPREVLAAIDAVTAEDVQATSRRLFRDQPLCLSVIGPFRSEAPFLRQLAA